MTYMLQVLPINNLIFCIKKKLKHKDATILLLFFSYIFFYFLGGGVRNYNFNKSIR